MSRGRRGDWRRARIPVGILPPLSDPEGVSDLLLAGDQRSAGSPSCFFGSATHPGSSGVTWAAGSGWFIGCSCCYQDRKQARLPKWDLI